LLDEKIKNKSSNESTESKRRKPRLRTNHHLMEPDELRPDERWDRIVELLALMTLPEVPAAPQSAEVVLISKSNSRI